MEKAGNTDEITVTVNDCHIYEWQTEDAKAAIKKADTVVAKLKDNSKSAQTGEHNQFAFWLMLLLPPFRVIGIEMSCGGLSEVQYCERNGIISGR